MKKLVFAPFIIFAALLFPSCFGEINPTEIPGDFSQYPLKLGNSWQYEREVKFINLRPDSVIGYLPDTAYQNSMSVTVPRKKTLLGSIETYVIREETDMGGSLVAFGEQYYANQHNGFYLHAYKGMSSILPKNSNPTLKFKNKMYQNIDQLLLELDITWQFPANSAVDSVIMEIPPLLILPYPLQIGQSWIYREAGNPFKIVKKVITRETLNTSAGQFAVKVIQWFYDYDNTGQWEEEISVLDYYSTIGLVKRSIRVKNLQLINQFNQVIGYFDYSEISELQYYMVK